MRLKFGDCVADFDAREVLVAGRPVHLEPRALRLLILAPVTRPAALSGGDRLRIGTVEKTLRRLAGDVSTQSVRSS